MTKPLQSLKCWLYTPPPPSLKQVLYTPPPLSPTWRTELTQKCPVSDKCSRPARSRQALPQESVNRFELVGRTKLKVIHQHLNRKLPAQCLAGSSVEQIGYFIQSRLRHQREIRALREVLA